MKTKIALLSLIGIGLLVFSFRKAPVTDKFCGSYTTHAPLVLHNIHGTPTSHIVYTGYWYQPNGVVNSYGNSACVSVDNCSYVDFINDLAGGTTYYGVTETGFNITNSNNITIKNCYGEKVAGGVYAQACQSIKVDSNQFKNMMGSVASGPRGQFVQFNNVTGPGNSISYNRGENFTGQSAPEDLINCYKTQGTITSPVRIIGNLLRGGGPSLTGAGITVGDGGGGIACNYISISYNILVKTGADGLQVAGGTNIQVFNNKVFSSAVAPISHVGLNVGNYSGGTMANITFGNNQVNWISAKPVDLCCGQTSRRFDQHITPGLPIPIGWNSNISNSIGSTILPTNILTTCTPIH